MPMDTDLTGILFDMDGVLYQGDSAIAGAAEVIQWCQQTNIPFLFLTNTTSRPRTALQEKLYKLNIHVELKQLLTPAVAASHWLQQYCQGPIALFVPQATQEEFQTLEIIDWHSAESVGAIVMGDLGEAWDFNTLNSAFQLLMRSPQGHLVALGLTRYWQAGEDLQLDVGPFVKALEYASGLNAIVMGKPAPAFFETALRLLNLHAHEVIMIGDDIRGDIDAAQQCAIAGILVRTGKYRPRDLEQDITPHAVLDSIADLPDWWHAE